MKLIPATYSIETPLSILRHYLLLLEQSGRLCYKSEDRITADSHLAFIEHIKGKQHDSVLEHSSLSVRFIVNRGISHELVRHRLCSFSQESTRYCNYSKDKFDGVSFIIPCTIAPDSKEFDVWTAGCYASELYYLQMLDAGCSAQEARDMLNHAVKTEVMVTANFREWRHILRQRTDKAAHPHMREVMVPLLAQLKDELPVIFGDL